MIKEFSPSVIEKIMSYVYCLVDPISNEIFYIGKGVGNRVFQHMYDALETSNASYKLDQIRRIKDQGMIPKHYIIRMHLTNTEAEVLEATLIDFARITQNNKFNLTNLVRGNGSIESGIRTVEDVYHSLNAREIVIEEPALIIIVNKLFWYGMSDEQLYEATRKAWVLSKRRLPNVKYVIASFYGIVREVYEVTEWFDIFDERTQKIRYGFTGKKAADEIRSKYVHQSSSKYKSNGNPIRYILC